MKLRVKFSKTGRVKYIGHLDLLNIFNRAVKAAKLPVSYSKGFNPHMQIAFASPLSLGIESLCEYVDIGFEQPVDFEELKSRVNEKFPGGIELLEVYVTTEPYKRVAAIVTHAQYRFDGLKEIGQAEVAAYLAQPEIMAMKKTKRRNELTDIRQDIFSLKAEGGSLTGIISCGSARNIKPTLLAQSLCDFTGEETPLYQIGITRTEILGTAESEGTAAADLLPLSTYL